MQKGLIAGSNGGNFINDTSGALNGLARNDGTHRSLSAISQNSPNAVFQVNTDNTSKERVVKFVGGGTQLIKGDMNLPGTASFYNLVIDKKSESR